MNSPLLDQLKLIDPLPADAQAPPLRAILERLDDTPRAPAQPPQPTRPRWRRRRTAFAAAAVAGASLAAALALSDTGGGVDVAAAAYRATQQGAGVLHMSIVTERSGGSSSGPTRRELWTAQNPRRLRVIDVDSEETLESALSTEPVRVLSWSSARPTVIKESSPAGVDRTESSPIALIHKLIGEGRATVAGKTTYEDNEAWRLQIHPETPPASFDGSQIPDPELIVAAGSYVPLEFIEHYATSENGKPELVQQRERYTAYQELPANSQNEALLQLAPHSGASIQREG